MTQTHTDPPATGASTDTGPVVHTATNDND